jgi:hypothetical protein
MRQDLDQIISALRDAPNDNRLNHLEFDVGRSIRRRQREVRVAQTLTPVRVAAITLALAIGVTTGSAAAVALILTPKPNSSLAGAAPLAPSSLLEGQR